MSSKKKELGKGIRALLANIETQEAENPVELVKDLTHTIASLPVDSIEPNPNQPRTDFDPVALNELSESLKVHGLIQPVTVRRMPGDKFQIISGERRFRASKMAGLKEIPAYIRIANDQEILEMALVENIQRKDLNPLEVAFTYQRLLDECNLTHEALATRVAKDRSTVTNFLRLIKLPPEIQSALKTQELSMGHARALAGIEDPVKMIFLYNQVRNKGMSVRETESLIRDYQTPKEKVRKKPAEADYDLRRVQNELSKTLETKVDIRQTAQGKGNITIHFVNTEDLNRIL
ncbi:MAG TPA: ParB/RepB/Spo0J family partition protein, partial [Saprospiraceae bacterium]|nr:ParB/RepB/Spo0J family partition protein [Saprospiraceae bacterium]